MSIDRLRSELRHRVEREIPAIVNADIDRAAAIAERVARRNAPVRRGVLRRGIRATREGETRVVVQPSVDYAAIQERRFGFMRAGLNAALNYLRNRGYR